MTSPAPSRRAAALPASANVENAVISRRTVGGKRVLLPPSGAVRTRRSVVAAPAKKSTTSSTNKVTPIPGNLSIFDTRAAIDEAVLADVNNEDTDDDDDDGAASDA
jgi:hypothetical protein